MVASYAWAITRAGRRQRAHLWYDIIITKQSTDSQTIFVVVVHQPPLCSIHPSFLSGRVQDDSVKLGNCHAALLEGTGGSWEQAFGDEASWRLVDVLTPESPSVQS